MINAELWKELRPKAMQKATRDVVWVMGAKDVLSEDKKKVQEFIRKEQKKLGDKQMVLSPQEMIAKKYSAGNSKNQQSMPKKNSQNYKNTPITSPKTWTKNKKIGVLKKASKKTKEGNVQECRTTTEPLQSYNKGDKKIQITAIKEWTSKVDEKKGVKKLWNKE